MKTKNKNYNNIYKIMGIPYNVIMFILIIFPFLIMIIYSFNGGSGPFQINFTFDHYLNFVKNGPYLKTMFESLYLAIMTTGVTLLIAYPLSYFIIKLRPGLQALIILLVTSPMWINMLIQVNAIKQITLMFVPGLEGTNFIIILGMVYMFLPYMVLPIYTSLSKIDTSLFEGSADLGANNIQTLRRVIIPLSMPGVISGITIVFLPAATTIIVSQYLGKGQRYLVGNLIEDLIINSGNYGYGSAIAIVLVVIMMAFVYLVSKFNKYEEVSENEN